MRCECGNRLSTVDTRHNRELNETVRRKKCPICKKIYYSLEYLAEDADEIIHMRKYLSGLPKGKSGDTKI